MRRRFQFRLRTMFVLVAVLGSLLGWLGVQLKWIHDRDEALSWMFPFRARQIAAETTGVLPPLKGSIINHAGSKAPWSLRLFGEPGVGRLEVDRRFLTPNAPYSLEKLRRLFPEAEVRMTQE